MVESTPVTELPNLAKWFYISLSITLGALVYYAFHGKLPFFSFRKLKKLFRFLRCSPSNFERENYWKFGDPSSQKYVGSKEVSWEFLEYIADEADIHPYVYKLEVLGSAFTQAPSNAQAPFNALSPAESDAENPPLLHGTHRTVLRAYFSLFGHYWVQFAESENVLDEFEQWWVEYRYLMYMCFDGKTGEYKLFPPYTSMLQVLRTRLELYVKEWQKKRSVTYIFAENKSAHLTKLSGNDYRAIKLDLDNSLQRDRDTAKNNTKNNTKNNASNTTNNTTNNTTSNKPRNML